MKLKKDIVSFSFRKHLECIRQEQERQAARHLILYTDGQLVQRHENSQSQFGRACITAGYLSPQQVEHATRRYHLGMSRDGGVIFWQIDMLGQVYDGKVMYYRSDCHRDHHHNPTWVGSLLKNFYLKGNKELIASIPSSHCLFGLHLLREEEIGMKDDGRLPTVAVVEAEKTAVIMSEVFPQYLWMATGGLSNLNEYALFPLRHHRVILFPDTDPSGKTYAAWYAVAQRASRLMGCTVTVSALLEQKATREQKQRKIDLVDYYFEP